MAADGPSPFIQLLRFKCYLRKQIRHLKVTRAPTSATITSVLPEDGGILHSAMAGKRPQRRDCQGERLTATARAARSVLDWLVSGGHFVRGRGLVGNRIKHSWLSFSVVPEVYFSRKYVPPPAL